jgi:hypothetical protein
VFLGIGAGRFGEATGRPGDSGSLLVLRLLDREAGDRLLAVNRGDGVDLSPAPEPLLAPPRGARDRRLLERDEST